MRATAKTTELTKTTRRRLQLLPAAAVPRNRSESLRRGKSLNGRIIRGACMSTVSGISEITGYVCVVHGGRVLATDLNSRLDSSFKRLFLKM